MKTFSLDLLNPIAYFMHLFIFIYFLKLPTSNFWMVVYNASKS